MIGGLLCRLGRHDPDPAGRWNGGYCFTHCRRCERDMVRSAFGEWHVPKGFKVVWKRAGDVADLDRVMAARSAPVAPAAEAVEVEPVSHATWSRPSPPDKGDPDRSPFDFGDFDNEGGGTRLPVSGMRRRH